MWISGPEVLHRSKRASHGHMHFPLQAVAADFNSTDTKILMKTSIASLILGIATAGAFTTAAAATTAAGSSFAAPAEAQAAPAPHGPAAEPNEESENEPSTMTVPEEPNGPGAKG